MSTPTGGLARTISGAVVADAPTLDESSSLAQYAALIASSSTRRKGLSTREKLCMYQIARPSPELKNNWCSTLARTRRHVRSESSLHALPRESSQVTCRSLDNSPSKSSISPTRRRAHRGGLSVPVPINTLAAQERHCSDILRYIYPATLTGMNFMKPATDCMLQEPECERIGSHVQVRDRVNSDEHRIGSMSQAAERKGSEAEDYAASQSSRSKLGSKNKFQSAVQQAELQLVRRQAPFDVASASPIGENALRLIQGASLTRQMKDIQVIRQKMMNNISHHRQVVFDFTAQMASLQWLRKKLLDSYPCIQDAINALNTEHHEQMDKREWCLILSRNQLCTLPEARAIYELMDSDHDGYVTPTEFILGVEVIAQVTTMDAFRKRLICLGFQSMTQAITVMNGGGPDITMRPLSSQEFAAALQRVHVLEDVEHKAIFDAVRDHGDSTCRASLSDLACGLAVVSPCLLLEDLRLRMTQDHGSLETALMLICPQEEVGFKEFKRTVRTSFGLTSHEAEVLFKCIDLDGGGEVSQDEIRRALNLAEGQLDLEDCRRKLRQGYRTIQAAFKEAYAPPEELEGLPSVFYFKVDEFADVLRPLGLGRKTVARLVALMGVSEHGVTISEFFSGARLFAPSVALEEFKMQLLQAHQSLELAFRDVKDRRAPLNRRQFGLLLKRLGTRCHGADEMFDFLDIRSAGLTTVSEIIAALQCLQAGHHKPLSSTESTDKVKSNVGSILQPAIRYAAELKAHVKEEANNYQIAEEGATSPLSAKSASQDFEQDPAISPKQSGSMQHQARRTFQKITSTLQVLPEGQEKKTVRELTNYFDSKETVLNGQKRMLDTNFRRVEERHKIERFKKLCQKQAAPVNTQMPDQMQMP